MSIRDMGYFVLAKMVWYYSLLEVDASEALGLVLAMRRVHDLQLYFYSQF
jgi:hypothetical protein